jgi:hypothetical protein
MPAAVTGTAPNENAPHTPAVASAVVNRIKVLIGPVRVAQ